MVPAASDRATDEMRRTFNCGIGMVVVVAEDQVGASLEALSAAGEEAFLVGRVVTGSGEVRYR